MKFLDWLRTDRERNRLEWRRLRYADAARAADALERTRQAGYPLELRLSCEGELSCV